MAAVIRAAVLNKRCPVTLHPRCHLYLLRCAPDRRYLRIQKPNLCRMQRSGFKAGRICNARSMRVIQLIGKRLSKLCERSGELPQH